MRTRAALLFLLYLISDLAAILAALLLSALYSISPHVIFHSKHTLAGLNLTYIYFLLCFVWYFSSKSTGLYDDLVAKPYSLETFNVLKNLVFQFLFLILILFAVKERLLTRIFVLSYSFMLVLIVMTEKVALRLLLTRIRTGIQRTGNVLIIGANDIGNNIYKKLVQPPLAYNVVGFIDDEKSGLCNGFKIEQLSNLDTMIKQGAIDMVITALPRTKLESLEYIISVCQNNLVEVKVVPDLAFYHVKGYNHSFLGDIPLVSIDVDRLLEPYWRIAKRMTDFILTALLVVAIFSWLIPLVMLLQKIFNPGRIFFESERWGKGGRAFIIYKFRTMDFHEDQQHTDHRSIPTERNDNRVTAFGRFLRRTSIDELPQFLNVLKGDMSIVGPRPFEAEEASQMRQILSKYMVRHYVMPGITGCAQINGYRGGTRNMSLMQKRIDLDNWYINNWTLGLDFQIILMTVFRLLVRDSNAY